MVSSCSRSFLCRFVSRTSVEDEALESSRNPSFRLSATSWSKIFLPSSLSDGASPASLCGLVVNFDVLGLGE